MHGLNLVRQADARRKFRPLFQKLGVGGWALAKCIVINVGIIRRSRRRAENRRDVRSLGAVLHGTFLRIIIVMKRMKIQDSKLPDKGESSDSSNALQKAKTDVQKPGRLDKEAEREQRETESWHTFKTF